MVSQVVVMVGLRLSIQEMNVSDFNVLGNDGSKADWLRMSSI